MTGLLINLDENEVLEVEIRDDEVLKDVRQAIGCDIIDVVRDVNIGGRRYDILVDDEGLLKPNPKPSARCMDEDQYLFGSIVVLNVDREKGEWLSLDHTDIISINEHIFGIRDKETMEISPMLEYYYKDTNELVN